MRNPVLKIIKAIIYFTKSPLWYNEFIKLWKETREVTSMKRTLLIIAVLLIGVSFITTTFAQDKPVKIVKPAIGKKGFAGEVVKVDVAENIIVVKGKKGEETYDIKDVKWKVYKSAEEVKAGDFVVISFMDEDGKKIAKRIIKGKKPIEKRALLKKDVAKPLPDTPVAPVPSK
jgi:hypothetical protein